MIRQRTEQFRSRLQAISTFPRELVWLLVGALILAGVIYVSHRQNAITWEPLIHDAALPAAEMDQLEIILADAGLTDCERREGQLMVPADQRPSYLRVLNQATGFQFRRRESDSAATETSSFFESEAQRHRKYLDAKAKHWGNKIASFPDIAWASVDYDEQATSGFDPKRIQSASVIVAPKEGKPLPPDQIQSIQDCISAAYAGMTADQVSVTDTAARKTYRGNDDPSTRRMQQAEYELEQRVAELLSSYPDLRISVTSIVQPRVKPSDLAAEQDSGTSQMQISVGVPDSQFHRQWISDCQRELTSQSSVTAPNDQQFDDARERVLESIRVAVAPLLLGNQTLNVWSYTDEKAKIAYAVPTSDVSDARFWGSLSQPKLWVILPLASLVVLSLIISIAALRMRLKESDVGSLQHSGEIDDERNVVVGAAEGETPGDEPNTHYEAARLRNDLADLVESNPELAAQIVHSWIADAA